MPLYDLKSAEPFYDATTKALLRHTLFVLPPEYINPPLRQIKPGTIFLLRLLNSSALAKVPQATYGARPVQRLMSLHATTLYNRAANSAPYS